jgi:hypothetical protein
MSPEDHPLKDLRIGLRHRGCWERFLSLLGLLSSLCFCVVESIESIRHRVVESLSLSRWSGFSSLFGFSGLFGLSLYGKYGKTKQVRNFMYQSSLGISTSIFISDEQQLC